MTGPDRFPTETEAFVLPGSFDQEPQPVDLRRDVGGDGAPSCQAPHRATVAEVPDRGALRDAGHAIERESLRRRDGDPLTPGAAMTAAGGAVHWARDGAEANLIVGDNLAAYGVTEALKTEPLTTDELGLTGTLGGRRIEAIETDLTPFAAAEGVGRLSAAGAQHRARTQAAHQVASAECLRRSVRHSQPSDTISRTGIAEAIDVSSTFRIQQGICGTDRGLWRLERVQYQPISLGCCSDWTDLDRGTC